MRVLALVALLTLWFGGAAAAADCPPPLSPSLAPNFLQGCDPTWPPDDGFTGKPVAVTLETGKLIDRFVMPARAANDNGRYFSPRGEPYPQRALPYVCSEMSYTVYQVRKAFTVSAGAIAPWFGSPGGGTQYQAVAGVQDLVKQGHIVPVPWLGDAPCGK